MLERKTSLVVRSVGEIAVVYFTDTKILEDMQIKWVGTSLYDLVDKQSRRHILINFQNIERFSTALLGKLIGLKKKTHDERGSVKMCCIPGNIMEIFKVTGLDAIFDIFPDETSAIKSFGSAAGE